MAYHESIYFSATKPPLGTRDGLRIFATLIISLTYASRIWFRNELLFPLSYHRCTIFLLNEIRRGILAEQGLARKKVTRVDIRFFEIYRDRLKYIFHARIEYPRCHRFYRLKCIFASKDTGPRQDDTDDNDDGDDDDVVERRERRR